MQEADYYAISCFLFIRIVIIATIPVIFNILLYFLDITRHVFIDPLHWPGRGSFLPTQKSHRLPAAEINGILSASLQLKAPFWAAYTAMVLSRSSSAFW